jgi:hypothetical protein
MDQTPTFVRSGALTRSADFRLQQVSGLVPHQLYYSQIAAQVEPLPSPHGVIDAFVKTCQRWHLSTTDQVTLLGYKGSGAFGRQFLDGRLSVVPQDIRDRSGYVLGISLGLGALFNDSEEAELRWLSEPRPHFGGRSAIDFMLEGRMENLMIVAQIVAAERNL